MLCTEKCIYMFAFVPPTQQFIYMTTTNIYIYIYVYVCSGSVNNTGLIKYMPL